MPWGPGAGGERGKGSDGCCQDQGQEGDIGGGMAGAQGLLCCGLRKEPCFPQMQQLCVLTALYTRHLPFC